jgi:AraC-like DNA-binding protein
MAQGARLSPSYFQHLFKTETGVPFRRYRSWARMGAALKAVRSGCSLTEAAHAAGFSSSAHFSSAFARMFGLPPSRLATTASADAAQAALHS